MRVIKEGVLMTADYSVLMKRFMKRLNTTSSSKKTGGMAIRCQMDEDGKITVVSKEVYK